ncbi:hypothetical protein EDC01DRAFT_627840 [Geopyxis carbonaria]|nr:hypothetical protein EDC01DRAFT_627840 [Geopyxis carbonaria]
MDVLSNYWLDPLNSGYLPNHNINPKIVENGDFVIHWKVSPDSDRINGVEMFMAKPLVYTPHTRFIDGQPSIGGKQLVIIVSESNWIYVLDAVSGEIIKSRQIRIPYNETLPCGDIIPVVGVTGTPIIDKSTDTIYLFAKGYNTTASGPFNAGLYHLHALDVLTLQERPGFPSLIDGPAHNDPIRYFTGGLLLQRPSIRLINGIVYGGFGGGCGAFNQTGINASSGKLVALWASQTGPLAPSVDTGFYSGGGGGSIWQASMGFVSDRSDRFFLVTSDGKVFNSSMKPTIGKNPPRILEGSVINMKILSDGTISPQDHFRPHNYTEMGTSLRDLGSGGLAMLDPQYFSGTGAGRLGVAGGENGILYLLDLDNLGGYKQGPNGTDAVLQSWVVPGNIRGRIYGSIGSYPLEGGYIYVKPAGLRSVLAYKFGHRYGGWFRSQFHKRFKGSLGTGKPFFSAASATNESIPTNVGVGAPVITTYKGKKGTGIVWIIDRIEGLTAYHAVPKDGKLERISVPTLPGRAKFQRPVFGDGRLYVVTTDGRNDKPALTIPQICARKNVMGSDTWGLSTAENAIAETFYRQVRYQRPGRLNAMCLVPEIERHYVEG